jgi:hypothetical protein
MKNQRPFARTATLSDNIANINLIKTAVTIFCALAIVFFYGALLAKATVPFPNQPVDLPPGAMSYGNESAADTNSGALPADPNIVAAVIGVAGLLAGSMITILATYFMRWMDVRREDRREDYIAAKSKREKEFALKHENYRDFLTTLAGLESMRPKDFTEFKKDWGQAEINLDLAASDQVRQAKELFKASLMAATENAYETGSPAFDPSYAENRDALIKAIREDIDLFSKES